MRIVLLSCTKRKAGYPAPAREFYSASPMFRRALAHVSRYADQIYVLSAKYGLVTLDQVLEPYDLTLNTMSLRQRRDWAERVLAEIQSRHGRDLSGVTIEFHTGEKYRIPLEDMLREAGATCLCPVAGLPIGRRLRYYAAAVEGVGG